LLLAAAVILVVAVLGGGYAYLAWKDRNAPAALALSSRGPTIRTGIPDGIWTSEGHGRLEIVGGWIERAVVPAREGPLRLRVPIDLTELTLGRPLHVRVSPTIELNVLWRRSRLQLKGKAGATPIAATYRRRAARPHGRAGVPRR
jgi:hypothetical protein